jgi:hypothetical protein
MVQALSDSGRSLLFALETWFCQKMIMYCIHYPVHRRGEDESDAGRELDADGHGQNFEVVLSGLGLIILSWFVTDASDE